MSGRPETFAPSENAVRVADPHRRALARVAATLAGRSTAILLAQAAALTIHRKAVGFAHIGFHLTLPTCGAAKARAGGFRIIPA